MVLLSLKKSEIQIRDAGTIDHFGLAFQYHMKNDIKKNGQKQSQTKILYKYITANTTYVNPTLSKTNNNNNISVPYLVPKSTECYRDVNLILCQYHMPAYAAHTTNLTTQHQANLLTAQKTPTFRKTKSLPFGI